ncbi:class I SAM-dependent methyltransferase [Hymenobacter terrenus]|uniref:class I SAM-dependent methyltransferase n=1 Tax=Hymenobacter terrenus TaxID=1629124 RepID=UPI000B12B7E2|nr:class I SAM-dependent methyltransferase [Hymenobacter terrenus]
MKDNLDYVGINKKMWELTADIYEADGFYDALQRVQQENFTTFDEVEQFIFATQIEIKDKDIIQIGCNNGTEIINLKKNGANNCVGIDISEKFIKQAKQLSIASNYKVEFESTNVYEISENHFGNFDLVYITVGVLGWMPDIKKLFQIINKLLKPEGQVFIYEQHPILGMFNPEPPHKIDSSYFRKEPFKDEILPEYIDKTGQARAISYWFPYTLADILNACIMNKLQLKYFEEYSNDISDTYKNLKNNEVRFPMSFTLIGQKI